MAKWKFDRKRAVRVVRELEPPPFRFEREVSAALLAIYALWPSNRDRLNSAARNLARLITFGEISPVGTIGTRFLSNLDVVRDRFAESWYSDFYEHFVKPLGGFSAVLEARSSRSLDRQIQKMGASSSTRVRYDLVRYLISMSQHNRRLATRGNAIRHVSENIFGVADHYGVTIRGKRKQFYKQDDPTENPTIGKKKIEKDWDDSPKTTVLLYAIERTLSMLGLGPHGTAALPGLQAFLLHPEAMAAALCLYECVMQHLEALPATNAVKEWRLFKVEGTFNGVEIPTFSVDDIQRLRRIQKR